MSVSPQSFTLSPGGSRALRASFATGGDDDFAGILEIEIVGRAPDGDAVFTARAVVVVREDSTPVGEIRSAIDERHGPLQTEK
jgi:hypothetical protein